MRASGGRNGVDPLTTVAPASVPVLAAVRTPLGSAGGILAAWHPVALAAHVLVAATARAGIAGDDVAAVLVACATPVGAQGANLARAATMQAGWPSVPAEVVSCGGLSGHRALAHGLAMVESRAARVVVVAGVESASAVPFGAAEELGRNHGRPWGDTALACLESAGGLLPHGPAVERLAAAERIDRARQDEVAATARVVAASARRAGWLDTEIEPLPRRDREPAVVGRDRPIAADEALDDEPVLADLPPAFSDGGSLTAGNWRAPGDGAAAVVLAAPEWAAGTSTPPLAVLVASSWAATTPTRPFDAAPEAAADALAAGGVEPGACAAIEIDDPAAAVVAFVTDRLAVAPSAVNPTGGPLGLGHPLGASGVRGAVGLVHALRRSGGAGLLVGADPTGLGAALVARTPSAP